MNEIPKIIYYFAHIFKRYCNDLMEFEDLVSAGYIGYLEVSKIRDRLRNYDSYLYKIIKFRMIDEIQRFSGIKRLGVNRKYIRPEFYMIDFYLLSDKSNVEYQICLNELVNMVKKLPIRYRITIESFYFEENSIEQICEKLNLKKSRVKEIKRESIKHLKCLYNDNNHIAKVDA